MKLLIELLKIKEAFVPMDDDDNAEEGTRVKIKKEYGGGMGTIVEPSPSGKFITVKTASGKVKSFHRSDLMIRM